MIPTKYGQLHSGCALILFLQIIIASILLIENDCVVGAATSRRSKPQRRIASRSRRGLIDSLGALDHTGKAADGWQKIQDHLNGLNGSDPPSPSPADDRAGTGSPSIIDIPTDAPTTTTSTPTLAPSKLPTKVPTKSASLAPTKTPVFAPVSPPTFTRTSKPTATPIKSTPSPTKSPVDPPTNSPTSTDPPTHSPTGAPTKKPTLAPTKKPTNGPTMMPTGTPTKKMTGAPTKNPTDRPTKVPTGEPTKSPSEVPSSVPSSTPSQVLESTLISDSKSPSPGPTIAPSESPSVAPSTTGTEVPVSSPTSAPSKAQSSTPTKTFTGVPSEPPSSLPSLAPTVNSASPTGTPTVGPSDSPSANPSLSPTKTVTNSQTPSATPSEEPSATPSATASPTLPVAPTPDDISDSSVLCPDVEPLKVSRLEVWWKYSVYFNADVDRVSAMTLFEMKLASELEDEVLQCDDGSDSRRLEGGEGIVGIDYLPLDEELEEVCPGVSVNCAVYKGTISLYLENDGNVEQAIEKTRKSIFDVMSENVEGIVGDDISQIEYLSPNMQTSAAAQGSQTGDNISTGDESFSPSTAAMASVGVVCAAIALTMGYRYKNRVDDAALSTIGPCGSQMTMTSSQMSGNTDSTPGLSAMMPSTYRLGESHCMDAILEGGDSSDTSSQAKNVSILVSESGYSEEDYPTHRRENYNMDDQSGEYLLGAHRVAYGYKMDQLLHDSFSDVQSPYDSSFEEPFPAHRRTYTGQSNALGPSPLAFLEMDDSEEF